MFTMEQTFVAWMLLAVVAGTGSAQMNETSEIRSGSDRALSVFQVVRFPNIECQASEEVNGTCYTSVECQSRGGIVASTCANGFGVCCTFVLGCGGKSSENSTYFKSAESQPAGHCGVTVCKASADICQLRIDMSTFVIVGPNTITNSVFGTGTGNNAGLSLATECLTDTFTIAGAGSSAVPAICGKNSGHHIYVDSPDQCVQLNFQFGIDGIGATLISRSWNMKISQISCYDPDRAPEGCTQYFMGATGTISTFNYQNKWQLANQRQTICIRRESGSCRICYSTKAPGDFEVSGTGNGHVGMSCCNAVDQGHDCVYIPGATKAEDRMDVKASNFCGKKLVDADSGTVEATICTRRGPYMVQFTSDALTLANAGSKGFRLAYWQTKDCK